MGIERDGGFFRKPKGTWSIESLASISVFDLADKRLPLERWGIAFNWKISSRQIASSRGTVDNDKIHTVFGLRSREHLQSLAECLQTLYVELTQRPLQFVPLDPAKLR